MKTSTQNRCAGMHGAWLALAAALALLATPAVHAQQKSTDWGWPLPYERVSDKSVQWLKGKGWWPIQVAYQAPWSGQNTINIVMDRQGLMKERGVDATWQAFPSGPAINETIVSAKFQGSLYSGRCRQASTSTRWPGQVSSIRSE